MKRFVCLCLVLALAGSLAGCTFGSPKTVGTLGDTEFTSGLYLLLYFNAYRDASTDDSDDEAVRAKTMDDMRHYAAVEQLFAQLDGTWTDTMQNNADTATDSIWNANEDILRKNGIGKETLRLYCENLEKESALTELLYGAGTLERPTDDAILAYVSENYYYGLCTYLPLTDADTGISLVGDAVKTQQVADAAEAIAEACRGGTDMYTAAVQQLPKVYALMDDEFDVDAINSNVYIDMYTPASIGDSLSKEAQATLKALDFMECGVLKNETNIIVFYRYDAAEYYSVDEMRDAITRQLTANDVTRAIDTAAAQLTDGTDAAAIARLVKNGVQAA